VQRLAQSRIAQTAAWIIVEAAEQVAKRAFNSPCSAIRRAGVRRRIHGVSNAGISLDGTAAHRWRIEHGDLCNKVVWSL
jgi:hypothetical protein